VNDVYLIARPEVQVRLALQLAFSTPTDVCAEPGEACSQPQRISTSVLLKTGPPRESTPNPEKPRQRRVAWRAHRYYSRRCGRANDARIAVSRCWAL